MKKKKKQIVKIDRTKLSAINPLLSLTSVSIFSILLPGHSRVLTRRICPTIKRFFIWWSSPLFSWRWCLIQGWCKEKLDVSHDKSKEEKMARGNKWLWIQIKYFSLKDSHYIIICFLFNYHMIIITTIIVIFSITNWSKLYISVIIYLFTFYQLNATVWDLILWTTFLLFLKWLFL